MSKEVFDRKLQALEALRSLPEAASTLEEVQKALRDRNNYFVSKAATIAADLQLRPLVPDLLAAFDRFLSEPAKSDPQCWAKNAIAKALQALDHRDPDVYIKGLRHFQLEPVWGGRSDTATTLRGVCALALVNCELDDFAVLRNLVDALADPEKPVRIDAVRAIAQLSRPEGALLLRLKILSGDREAEVVGQCLSSLLSLSGSDAVDFAARALDHADAEIRMEAAGALGQSAEPGAVLALKGYWERCADTELKRTILISLGASPLRDAAEFLLSILSDSRTNLAREALTALSRSRFRSELRERVANAVTARRFHESLSETMTEWLSPEDEKASGNL